MIASLDLDFKYTKRGWLVIFYYILLMQTALKGRRRQTGYKTRTMRQEYKKEKKEKRNEGHEKEENEEKEGEKKYGKDEEMRHEKINESIKKRRSR